MDQIWPQLHPRSLQSLGGGEVVFNPVIVTRRKEVSSTLAFTTKANNHEAARRPLLLYAI